MPWDGRRGARLNIREEGEGVVRSMVRAGAEIHRLALTVGFEPQNTKSFDRRSRQLKTQAGKEHSCTESAVLCSSLV